MIRKINLQLFAGAETGDQAGAADLTPAGGAPAGSQTETQPAEGEGEKEKDPAKAFAARLGHERKKMEAEYSPYKALIERQAKAAGMDVKEFLEYTQKQAEQEELEAEAEKQGKTPDLLKAEKEANEAKERLAKLERKEKLSAEEKELVNDPKIGKFVADNLKAIRDIAEKADTDLRTGLAIIAAEKLPELLELADIEKQKDKIIKEYTENIRKGGKPIEIGGSASMTAKSPPKSFEEARANTIEYLKNINQS